jgi:hypothetical protein
MENILGKLKDMAGHQDLPIYKCSTLSASESFQQQFYTTATNKQFSGFLCRDAIALYIGSLVQILPLVFCSQKTQSYFFP